MTEQAIRVAFPSNDGKTISEHFGHCAHFVVFNIAGKEIVSREELPAPPHEPGVLPKFLGEKNVTAIVCGGMGQRAIDLFDAQNINVVLGAGGNIEELVPSYISGQLASTGAACKHEH